jgi:hypothetical protein
VRRHTLLCAIIFTAAFLGVLPALYFEARWLTRHGPARPIDERYGAILPSLPAARSIGYVSDVTGTEALALRAHAQLSVAPHLLAEPNASVDCVLADLKDPSRVDALCARRNLRPVVVLSNGVALLETRVRP